MRFRNASPIREVDVDNLMTTYVWVLAMNGMISAEFDAEYVWEFMDQSMRKGKGGYCVTILTNAMQVLKNIDKFDLIHAS